LHLHELPPPDSANLPCFGKVANLDFGGTWGAVFLGSRRMEL